MDYRSGRPILAVLAVCLSIAGCSDSPPQGPEAVPRPALLVAKEIARTESWAYSSVYRFTDPTNGITCYIMGGSNPAIECLRRP